MTGIILTSPKPPVTPAPATGDQYIDRYNKRFRNSVTTRSEAEKEEATILLYDLIQRSIRTYGEDYGKDMRMLYVYPFDAYDLDALRVYDKMFDHGDPYDIRKCIVMMRNFGESAVSNVITPNFIRDFTLVRNAMNEYRVSEEGQERSLREFDKRRNRLIEISLLNPSKALLIPSIITDRRITDPEEVIAVLEDMEETATVLVGGIL